MVWRSRRALIISLEGPSLRRRVAFSLGLVRLILVPVIFLAVYYLFAMGSIVDRIVSVDAPVATNAERASIEMLNARRAERNYFLLHDPADIDANRAYLRQLERTIQTCRALEPEERPTFDELEGQIEFYRENFNRAVERLGESNLPPIESLRQVVRTYQQDLDDVLTHSGRGSRAQMIEMLRARIGSFDAEVAATVQAEDPQFRQTSQHLSTASQKIIDLSTELESRSWQRVQQDHEGARALLRRAEWIGGIISALTLLVSVWVSFLLPRQVVKPLTDLKEAVDHAAAGNYEIEFDVKGDSEVVQLADSVRNLIGHVREKHNNAGPTSKP
ncbi:MAG: HAMP domain-containing protein [Acidobacteriia bacterium]|nr:HAMP domain-containing protein [Terriglobia bacterium]